MSEPPSGLSTLWQRLALFFARTPTNSKQLQKENEDESSQPFHIAIIGAGIGGLALAISLHRHGVPFTVYESAASYATVGAGVGIGPNAMRAMDMIDKRFRGEYDKVCIGNLTPGKEHVMMEAAMIEDGFGAKHGWKMQPWGSQSYTRTGAHRKDLLDIMTALMPEGCVTFKKRINGITDVADGVELQFEDGERTRVSAVIGCDGVKGFTRGHVLSPQYADQVLPKYAHQYAYRAIIPIEDARKILGDLANDARMYFGKKVNLSTYVISEGREINVVGFVHDESPWEHCSKVTREVTRERMETDFKCCDVDQRLIQLLKVGQNC
jgi:salicylate hydroxylase